MELIRSSCFDHSWAFTADSVVSSLHVGKCVKRSVEQSSTHQDASVFNHRRLFDVVIDLSTFSMFKHTQKTLQVLNCSRSARLYTLRYLINAGDDWLLHSAAGTFDVRLWGHVMKEIYNGTEDQTLSPAELRYGLPWVPSLSPAGILRAGGLNLQMYRCSPSDVFL